MSTAEETKAFWDRAAAANAAWYTATAFDSESDAYFESGSHDTDAILGYLGVHLPEDSTVLEIGSGVGRMTRRLSQRWAHVIAADVSAQMLARARTNLAASANVEFLELPGDGSLPVLDQSLDLVFSYITMQHVSRRNEQEKYFAESLRVIRPGGWVVMQFRRDGARDGLRSAAANVVHALQGKKTLNPAWRGARMSEAILRSYRTAEISVDVLRLDDGHIWSVARRARRTATTIRTNGTPS
jgi:ubiquinone/menaquinone biosynthesis C-methylase UbiE